MGDTDIIKQLSEALKAFSDSVEKDVAEVREQKAAVQEIKRDILNVTSGVHYLRDNNVLVLSAPKVIIGNVDPDGRLIGNGGSEIVLRGNNIALEATGSTSVGGSIVSKAASIRNIAVDPGIDGTESVVCASRSEIVNQAQSIALNSTTDKCCFSTIVGAAGPGITLCSETTIDLNATPSAELKSKDIDAQLKSLGTQISDLKTATKTQYSNIEGLLKSLQKIVDGQMSINDSDMHLAIDYADLADLQESFTANRRVLFGAVGDYINTVAAQAELNRRKKALEAIKKDLSSKKSDFKTKPVGASINLNSENVNITSIDGDGNLRDIKEAGMHIQMPHIAVTANDRKCALMKDSSIVVSTQDFALCTVNPALDDKQEKGNIPAVGTVTVTSKEVLVQAVDAEKKSNTETAEKALTVGGKITMRAETIAATATDTEGKSTGKLSLNAKTMNIAAMDVDKEKRTDKEMAAGSKLTILAEKNYVGTTKKTKLIQLAAEKVGIMGKDTAEMQQDGKAVVTLSGGNMSAGGSAVELSGDTTIKGGADIKGEAKAPKVTAQQVEASAAFKSPTINDTMGAGVAAPAGKPSAKMTEEEAKTS